MPTARFGCLARYSTVVVEAGLEKGEGFLACGFRVAGDLGEVAVAGEDFAADVLDP
jgi:hypothetical protein